MTAGTAGPASGADQATERAARLDLVRRALHLAEVGRVPEAYPLLAEALRADPEDPTVQLAIAHCYQLQGRWSNMLTMLDLAVRRAPADPQVHRKRSVALRELGRVSEALAAAEQARALDPHDARNEIVRAEALLRRRGTRAVLGALAAAVRARELDPQSVWAHLTEASVWRRMAEFGRARAAYQEALRLAPENPTALHGLATLDGARGRAVRAEAVLGGMLAAAPTDPAALRAARIGARQALWLLTDLGCLVLLVAAVLVGAAQELPTRFLAATVGGGRDRRGRARGGAAAPVADGTAVRSDPQHAAGQLAPPHLPRGAAAAGVSGPRHAADQPRPVSTGGGRDRGRGPGRDAGGDAAGALAHPGVAGAGLVAPPRLVPARRGRHP